MTRNSTRRASLQRETRLGQLTLECSPAGKLRAISLETSQAVLGTVASRSADFHETPLLGAKAEILAVLRRLTAYLDHGQLLGVPPWELLECRSWTPFQEKVYRAISRIPFGETRSYGWVASAVGKPGSARAVGQALRRNPFPLLIPCHRVVGAQSLGGFSGSDRADSPELALKRELLALEASVKTVTLGK